MIEFKNVSVKYINDFYSLFNTNFKFKQSTLLIGESIFGSHAVMRLISKIDKDFSGEIYIDDTNIKDISDKNLPICYCPQKPELFNSTIEKNLIYPLKIRKFSKISIKNLVNSAITNYFNDFPRKISQLNLSQRKLVALVRGLIRRPKYVLLEDLFNDLKEEYFDLSFKILNDFSALTFIACEEKYNYLECFKNFEKINLN